MSLDTVTVATDSHPEPVRYRYASMAEAVAQADYWVALGVSFASDGTRWTDVHHGRRKLAVRGYQSGQVDVIDRYGAGKPIWWSVQQIDLLLRRHGLDWPASTGRRGLRPPWL